MSDYFKNIINDFFEKMILKNKTYLEFGPCITEDRMNIIKYIHNNNINCKCNAIDLCKGYEQNINNSEILAKKYNFNLEIKDYNDVLHHPIKIKKFKLLYNKKYDIIFCRNSWNPINTLKLLKLCNYLSKDNTKILLIPWLTNKNLSKKKYIEIFNIDYSKFGFTTYITPPIYNTKDSIIPNFIITKNIKYSKPSLKI